MTNSIEPNDDVDRTQQIASYRHLTLLVVILIALVCVQAMQLHWMATHPGLNPHLLGSIQFCLASLAMEWALVGFIWFGIRKYGISIRQLIGGDRKGAVGLVRDAALGFAVWLAWMIPTALVMYHFVGPQGPPKLLVDVLPRTGFELGFWIALAFSVGFAEELVFRGYFQRQLMALTKRPSTAIVGQGIIFGLIHIYQGAIHVAVIAVLGVVLGLLAHWRQSLRPGIIAHIWMDSLAFSVVFLRH